MKTLFFIPSFNDQEGLPELIQDLVTSYSDATVLVVDDGSDPAIVIPEQTKIQNHNLFLLRLSNNEGLGLATSIALDYFLDGNFDFFVRLDADGQHPLNQIEGLLIPLRLGETDVVWGERTNNLKIDTPKALLGSISKILTARLGGAIFRSNVKDWFTGFFAINRIAAAHGARCYLERYCEVQLLCIFHSVAMRIKTHQVEQLDRKYGKTRILWKDGVMILLRSVLMLLLYALRMNPK